MAGDKEVASLYIGLRANSDKLHSDLSNMQAKIAITGRALGNVLSAAIAGGITFGIRAATRAAMDFESALGKVKESANISPEGLLDLGKELKEMSKTMPISATELAKLAASAAQFGIESKDIGEVTKMVAKMGVAWGMTGEEAGAAIFKIGRATHTPLQGLMDLGDAIDVLGDKTGATSRGIAEAMQKVGATGTTLGFTNKEVAALAATMESLGQKPKKVGTALLSLFTKMGDIRSQSKEFKMMLYNLGFDYKEFIQIMEEDPKKGIMMLFQELAKLDSPHLLKASKDLFGNSGPVIMTVVKALQEYNKNLELVNNTQTTAGSVEASFAARTETTASKFQMLKNALSIVAIDLGTSLLPTVTTLTEAFVLILTPVGQFIEKFPNLSRWVTTTAVGLWALNFVLGIVGANLGGVALAAVRAIGMAFGALLTGLWSVTVAIATNPWLAAIALLIVAAALIITHWDQVKTFFEDIWEDAEDAWDNFKEKVDEIFSNISSTISGAISGIIGRIKNWIAQIEQLRRKLSGLLGLGGDGTEVKVTGGDSGGASGGGGAAFAHGGSFIVGGRGPTDTSKVSFMATPGERVTVETPGQQRMAEQASQGDGAIVQNFNVSTGVQETVRAELLSMLPGIKMSMQDSLSRLIARNSRFSSKIRYNV